MNVGHEEMNAEKMMRATHSGGDGSGRIVCHSEVDEVCLSRTAVITHTYAFIKSIDDFGTLVTRRIIASRSKNAPA